MDQRPHRGKLRAEVARRSEFWLPLEKPWEMGGVTIGSVIQKDW
jgi:hypothetical protein